MTAFSFKLLHQHSKTKARVTQISTPHGDFITPVFMPVGTRAGVNNLTSQELKACGSQIILGGNTYHMLAAPGMEVIEGAGGMHRFMDWSGPMLTDSGGFQVFSLKECRIDENGAHFKLPGTEKDIHMTPSVSLSAQKIIGADIIMAFDQCTADNLSKEAVALVMQRTHRWLLESIDYHQEHPRSRYGLPQALFGIIQGGIFRDLRRESADFVSQQAVDGLAIGGESIGFDMGLTVDLIREVDAFLPKNKPRYSMGVGMSPQDLLDVVAEGIDMFDCVAPTRNARHGALYCGQLVERGDWLRFESTYEHQRIQIKKSCFATDFSPIMPDCTCYTCQHYSRSYLHHLFKQKASSFTVLACIHNVQVMHMVCARMRDLITRDSGF